MYTGIDNVSITHPSYDKQIVSNGFEQFRKNLPFECRQHIELRKLRLIFKIFAKLIGKNDVLLFFLTAHGNNYRTFSFFCRE